MKRNNKKRWITVFAAAVLLLAGGSWYAVSFLPFRQVGQQTAEQSKEPPVTESRTEKETETETEESELPSVIYVYLCGSVQLPGVYALPEKSRLKDALALAGGFSGQAAREYHNLARIVADGERIYVPTEAEVAALSVQERVTGAADRAFTVTAEETARENVQEDHRVNLNTASVAELTTLPGIGEARAEEIVEYRTRVGRFASEEELKNIRGIGEAMYERLKDRITVQ